jgi:hypothetical protein
MGRDAEKLEGKMKTLLKWLGWWKEEESMFEKYYDKFMYTRRTL